MDRPNPEGTRAPPEQENESSGANKRLRIVTRCGTLDEFFATFGPFADETSLFIVTNKPRPLGLRQPFVIQLREGETIMRGDVEVVQSVTDGTGPDGRNGMRLRLDHTDDASRDILRRLVEHQKERRARATERPPVATSASDARPATGDTKAPPKPTTPPAAPSASPTAPATIAPGAPAPSTIAPKASDDAPPPSRSGAALDASGERIPGATYQLPANPFEGVTAEALESFIECTLYEERVPRAPADDPSFPDAPPPSRSGSGLSSFPQSIVAAAPSTLAPPGSPALPPLPALPPPPPSFAAPPPPTFGPAPTSSASASGSAPVRDAVLLAAAIQAASVPQRRAWIPWVIGTAVASSLASLAAAYVMWGKGPETTPAGPTATAVVTSPPPERTGQSAAPTTSATVSAAPTASATASAVATSPPLKRECKANVRSYPPGATVQWNGEAIGLSPLQDVMVPCGPAKVTFDLTGYEHGERSAGAVVGKNAGVFIRLVPILVSVDVTSTPAGAQILVDGRTVGRTPATISMVGMREATLVVNLPKYRPSKQKVMPEPPKMTIHVDLQSN